MEKPCSNLQLNGILVLLFVMFVMNYLTTVL
ncbi:unnamed protein product, partial [marine sediment metagenome]